MEEKQCYPITVIRVVKKLKIVMVTANGIENLQVVFITVEQTMTAILKRYAPMKNVFHLTQTVLETRIANLKRNAKMKNVFDRIHIQHVRRVKRSRFEK